MRGAWIVIAGVACAWATVAGPALGGKLRTFTIEGREAFGEARMSGVSLDADGVVAPGPSLHSLLNDAGAQVWSLAIAGDGTIYAGSGSDGGIYRIRGDRGERAAASAEYEVFAVHATREGRIFAAGAPNATIVELKADDTLSTLFDSPEQVAWSILSAPDGGLYVATGEKGRIYLISRDGSASIVHRSEEGHLMSMALLADGKLAVGTAGRGLLLEIDPAAGRSRVLHDSQSDEVTRVAAAASGDIFFAVGRSTRAGGPMAPPGEDAPKDDEGSRTGENPSLWRRTPEGLVTEVWRSPDQTIHALIAEEGGDLLVGTGGPAGLYRVTPRGEATLLWRPEEGQVLSIAVAKGSIYVGTGNPGRVYRLGPDGATGGWIQPKPIDAGSAVRWGRAAWEVLPGSGEWSLRTRSGMTDEADSSWSPWSDRLTDPQGSLITSPPARFLQIEARFDGPSGTEAARMRRVWIPGSEPNLPPRISGVRFSQEGGGFSGELGSEASTFTQDLGDGVRVQIQRNAPQSTLQGPGPPPWVRSVRSIVWDASDPNDDALLYDVDLRRVGETEMRPLARRLRAPALAIDTATLPDGEYEVRVRARDEEANAPGEGLADERTGGPFRVDHAAPRFSGVVATRTTEKEIRVTGTVEDLSSPIRSLSISWDAGTWRPLVSRDGILDGSSESFEARIDLETPEEGNWIAIRAIDASGNEALERIWLATREREAR